MTTELLGTSYAPGHDFWPGAPLSWWVRGTLGFLLVAGPQLLAPLLAVRTCRRRQCEPIFCAMAGGALLLVWLGWPALLGLRFHEGDMPWFRGLVWGYYARHWLLVGGIIACVLATRSRPRDGVGFPVIARTR